MQQSQLHCTVCVCRAHYGWGQMATHFTDNSAGCFRRLATSGFWLFCLITEFDLPSSLWDLLECASLPPWESRSSEREKRKFSWFNQKKQRFQPLSWYDTVCCDWSITTNTRQHKLHLKMEIRETERLLKTSAAHSIHFCFKTVSGTNWNCLSVKFWNF